MKAISSMATKAVLADLAAQAENAGLSSLEIESVGGVLAADRVAAGETLDLVFLQSNALAKLSASGHVVADSVVPLLLSQVAVAVPSGEDAPAARPEGAAFADAEGVRDALRAASRIGYSTGPSGTALIAMIDEWGMTPEIGDRLVQAQPGIPVAASLAAGEVDLGFQQLSELVGQPGVRILGVLPDDCAVDTIFSGAVAATAQDAGAAQAVLDAFASVDAAEIKIARSFGVPQL